MRESPYFPADALKLPDRDLGILLFGAFVLAQADDLGMGNEEITEEFETMIRTQVLSLEVTTAKNAAVEKALHKAAKGEFNAAGKMIREHLVSGAYAMKFIPIGVGRHRQMKEFGSRGTHKNKKAGRDNRDRVFEAASQILAKRTRKMSARQLASQVAPTVKLSEEAVRKHISRLRRGKLLG